MSSKNVNRSIVAEPKALSLSPGFFPRDEKHVVGGGAVNISASDTRPVPSIISAIKNKVGLSVTCGPFHSRSVCLFRTLNAMLVKKKKNPLFFCL